MKGLLSLREFLYYIGWIIFFGSIVISGIITFNLDLIEQPAFIIIAPTLIPGMGLGAILLGLWKLIEIQEKKLKILERKYGPAQEEKNDNDWEG